MAIGRLADHCKSRGIRGERVARVKVPKITASEFRKMVEHRRPFVLLDVREPEEYQTCRIPGSRVISLGDVLKHMHEFDPEDTIVVHCRSAARSALAAEWLIKAGFRKVRNLKGGVVAWAEQVGPSMPRH